ncbi:MAG: tetratricopeptide repeat protein [Desulfobacteraceae bacterium]|nr:tetratricopeptide repeat protein [Desulfobacteraceae bacterium]
MRKLSYFVMIGLLAALVAACASQQPVSDKKKAEASRNLGEALMQQGDYPAALSEFLAAEKLNPDDPILQNDLGLFYRIKDRLDLAIHHFKRAIELKPGYAVAKNNLGEVYLQKKEWDTAIPIFKELSENLLYATPHYPLNNLGFAYYNKGDFTTAETYYLKALKIRSDFLPALLGLGKTYIALGNGPEAVPKLEKAASMAPLAAEIHFFLGQAYQLNQEYTKALSAYDQAAAVEPDSVFAAKARQEAGILRQRYGS